MARPPTSVPAPMSTFLSEDSIWFHFHFRYLDSYLPKPLSSRLMKLPAWWENWTTKPSSTAATSGAPEPAISFCCRFSCWALYSCLLYTSDAADDLLCVDLGGR